MEIVIQSKSQGLLISVTEYVQSVHREHDTQARRRARHCRTAALSMTIPPSFIKLT